MRNPMAMAAVFALFNAGIMVPKPKKAKRKPPSAKTHAERKPADYLCLLAAQKRREVRAAKRYRDYRRCMIGQQLAA